jgi:hypothetical protein
VYLDLLEEVNQARLNWKNCISIANSNYFRDNMASSHVRIFEGDEWENYIQLLLKRHYGPGNYQEVAAKHCGDYGIEGYSMDGCVYQCYATQEPCPTQQRYEAQRNKITADIGKFIKNKANLIKLFGETSIRRWILVVPTSESAQLVDWGLNKSAISGMIKSSG